ncbi:hypothetical protein [Exiguobacterium sp. s193]|uniref:hypothetical protein n=1 Tax=Exiguobacterium sp. s193 TaxID=2751207 RepID=UPI001BE56912|nr:hypothetical protein [Exiguobacterium sp. s193]
MINQSIQLSFRQVRALVEHTLLLFKELDQQLANRGYEPILPDLVQTEHGMSIHQTKDSAESLVPHFLTRSYVRQNDKHVQHALVVSVQYTHPLHERFDPVVLVGDITFKQPKNVVKLLTDKPWLLKYAAFESTVASSFEPTGERFSTQPIEEIEQLDVWGHSFTEMRDIEDVTRLVEEMITGHLEPGTP